MLYGTMVVFDLDWYWCCGSWRRWIWCGCIAMLYCVQIDPDVIVTLLVWRVCIGTLYCVQVDPDVIVTFLYDVAVLLRCFVCSLILMSLWRSCMTWLYWYVALCAGWSWCHCDVAVWLGCIATLLCVQVDPDVIVTFLYDVAVLLRCFVCRLILMSLWCCCMTWLYCYIALCAGWSWCHCDVPVWRGCIATLFCV